MPSKRDKSWKFRNRAKATPAQLVVIRAQEAEKRRRMRYRARFASIYGRRPATEADHRIVRQMLRGHPVACPCVDCAWDTGEETYQPRVMRVVG